MKKFKCTNYSTNCFFIHKNDVGSDKVFVIFIKYSQGKSPSNPSLFQLLEIVLVTLIDLIDKVHYFKKNTLLYACSEMTVTIILLFRTEFKQTQQ